MALFFLQANFFVFVYGKRVFIEEKCTLSHRIVGILRVGLVFIIKLKSGGKGLIMGFLVDKSS